MIIDLRKSRNEYFDLPKDTEILRRFVDKEKITVRDIQQLDEEQVVVGTPHGDLDEVLREHHTVDSLGLVGKVDALGEDQLLVLPPEYRIDAGQAREVVAYSDKSLVLLDSRAVKEAITGEDFKGKSGALSGRQKIMYVWDPERVIGAACNLLHEQKDEKSEHTFSSYAWWGKDDHRRIVSLYRAIQGAELRAFQNNVAYRLETRKMKKELRLLKDARTKEPLTNPEIQHRKARIRRYDRYVDTRGIRRSIAAMDVSFKDLIEISGAFSFGTGQTVRVPSRSQRDGKREILYREIDLTDVPILAPGDEEAYALCWEIAGNDTCKDKRYRSQRRRKKPGKGKREDFYCSHEIAAAHSLRKIYANKERTIEMLPFVIPTKEMIEYVDALRYQAVMLEKTEAGNWTKRALNHTEIENLVWKRVMEKGYEACFTADIGRFKEERYDPHLDLVKFTG